MASQIQVNRNEEKHFAKIFLAFSPQCHQVPSAVRVLQIGLLDHIQLADSNSENHMFLALLLLELLHFEYGCGDHVANS